MEFTTPDFRSTTCFITLCCVIVFLFLWNVIKVDREAQTKTFIPVTLGLAAWLGLFSLAVHYKFITPSKPISILITFVSNILVVSWIGFSSLGKRLAENLSLRALVAFQIFRLPLELILHRWAHEAIIPKTMTWTGFNFDIITGIIAFIGYFFVDRYPWVARVVNIVGLSLLINVGRVALLSSPLPFAWPVYPKLQLLFYLPYAFIVPICIGGALAGHIILSRSIIFRLKK